jgi:hypothetical protein
MTSTTTVDCNDKTLTPTTEHTRLEKALMIAKGAMQKRNNNKNKTNPTPVFVDILPRQYITVSRYRETKKGERTSTCDDEICKFERKQRQW